jgi:transglutaminase-like putative cysteine protease
MIMKLNSEHSATYTFKKSVGCSIQHLGLKPQGGFGPRVNYWQVKVSGHSSASTDAFINTTHTLELDSPHQEIVITASAELETDIAPPAVVGSAIYGEGLALAVYLRNTALTQANADIQQFAHHSISLEEPVDKNLLVSMMNRIAQQLACEQGLYQSAQSAIEALLIGKASSQAITPLFIACCPANKVATKFVHGYCFNPLNNQVVHLSWADAWLIGQGWQSFDVANNAESNEIHVRLATGLDNGAADPLNSVLDHANVLDHAKTSVLFHVLVNSMEQSQ